MKCYELIKKEFYLAFLVEQSIPVKWPSKVGFSLPFSPIEKGLFFFSILCRLGVSFGGFVSGCVRFIFFCYQ